jgi:hypothetical protein
MLHNTKLVIGKAVVHRQFLEGVLKVTAPAPRSKRKPARKVAGVGKDLRLLLEAYEIYPTDDELSEVMALFGAMKTPRNVVGKIVECLGNEQIGGRLSRLGNGYLEPVVELLLNNGVSPLRDLLPLLNCVICPFELEKLQVVEVRSTTNLRCPEWPCPTKPGPGA